MNSSVVALLAEHFPKGLWHPGDPANDVPPKALPLPGLAHSGLPDDQAAQFAREAGLPDGDVPKLLAEAIVALIETDHEIVPRVELEQLKAEAATIDQPVSGQSVDVVCGCNKTQPLLQPVLGRRVIQVSGRMLKARIEKVCTCPA